jgi:hypothetical protein
MLAVSVEASLSYWRRSEMCWAIAYLSVEANNLGFVAFRAALRQWPAVLTSASRTRTLVAVAIQAVLGKRPRAAILGGMMRTNGSYSVLSSVGGV